MTLKSVRKWVDKFCYNHPKFGIDNLMKYIVILSAVIFVINMMDRTGTFLGYLAFSPYRILHGEVWRLVSWVFIPTSSFPWIIIELYFYYFIGNTLEGVWGAGRFTIYYIFGLILNVIYGFLIYLIFNINAGITTFYLNLSMFFAFAAMFPDQQVLLFFIIPVKVKWLAWIDAAFLLLNAISNVIAGYYVIAVLPVIAILNFFIFCGEDLMKYARRSRFGSVNSNTINFRKEARKYQKSQANRRTESGKPYRHKCAVCGRTDADYPQLEFRYCSRCAGYHCFCMDHINNHIHFTE